MASKPSKLDIVERVSFISNSSKTKERLSYVGLDTPDIEKDALREGGVPNLYSREYCGLLAQYATVGLVYGTLPATIYPFLQNYLNMPGMQTITAQTLVDMPWCFKVLYGVLSDSVPIRGYRRRPYMLLGWTLCLIMLIVMACSPVGEPYYTDPSVRTAKPEDYTAADKASLNPHAQTVGSKYVILMMLAAGGYVMSDCAADGVVVELAQREPEAVRGTIQTTIYTVRTIFVVISQVLVAFAFNGADYGGDFNFSISFPLLMLILAFLVVPILPITWIYIKEERNDQVYFKQYCSELWQLIQTRAIYQIIAYKFLAGIFENFSYVAINPIQSYWARVTPLNEKISNLVGNMIFAVSLYITGRYGLHWNWRTMAVVTMLSAVALDSVCTMLTTWGIVRNQWFWLGLPIVQNLPQGIGFIVSSYVTVELAGEGNESAVYGLITTISNLTISFAATLTKYSNKPFEITTERIQNDSTSIRKDVTTTILLMYACKIFSLFFLPMLPRQKKETQELKQTGGSSRFLGGFTIFYLSIALSWTVSTNLLGIFESTSCLVIAGGDGC